MLVSGEGRYSVWNGSTWLMVQSFASKATSQSRNMPLASREWDATIDRVAGVAGLTGRSNDVLRDPAFCFTRVMASPPEGRVWPVSRVSVSPHTPVPALPANKLFRSAGRALLSCDGGVKGSV